MIALRTGRRDTAGFTLIEIVITFLIIVLIIGIGALSLGAENTKKQIVGPAVELKKLARRGLQMAINNRHSFALALSPTGFALREGSAQVTSDAETDPRFAALFEEERENAGGVIESYELKEEMYLQVLRWGEEFYRRPEGDMWVFEPSGICEPIGIRLIHPEGSIEMQFNPLTAKVQDQSLLIDGEGVPYDR
jgi:hypothetical protein